MVLFYVLPNSVIAVPNCWLRVPVSCSASVNFSTFFISVVLSFSFVWLESLSSMSAFTSVNCLGQCCEVTSCTLIILAYICSLFLNSDFFQACMCLCVVVCMWGQCPQRTLDLLQLELQSTVSSLTWVLGTGVRPSARAASILTHRAIPKTVISP